MKWVSFTDPALGTPRAGILVDRQIRAAEPGRTLVDCFGASPQEFTELGAQLTARPVSTFELDKAQLLAPVPRPPAVRDFMVFEEHLRNASAALGLDVDPSWWENPVFYFTNPAGIRGHGADIPTAPGTAMYDYEAELGVVVGWPSADVAPADAGRLIAGYCLFIDWSARDLQRAEMRHNLGPAKGKDTAISLGPVLVTADEMAPHRSGKGFEIGVRVSINDQPYTDSGYARMVWSFEQMIAYAARGTELYPGDVIGSGTCGRGCISELRHVHGPDDYPWLAAGDRVRIEAGVLGVLEHTIVAGPTPVPLT